MDSRFAQILVDLPQYGMNSAVLEEVALERALTQKLTEWAESPKRKPLLLQGARQVGKTWLLEDFARRHYEDLTYYNLDEDPANRVFFTRTKNPDELVRLLSAARGRPVLPARTLIVFDESQASPEALGSLKYFCEHAPQYHVAAAGSLLGVMLAQPGAFPVGRVHIEYLHSMSFTEFLQAGV